MILGFFRRRKRQALRSQPFPAEWLKHVRRNIPRFASYSRTTQAELLGHAQVLLAEKHFEGCGDLELTDEMRVTIAVQASVLLLNRDDDYFPTVHTVLVYPASVVHRRFDWLSGASDVEADGEVVVGLHAGREGVIVLSWEDAQRGLSDPEDGHDVVLHEFAHALDQQNRRIDGTPSLGSRSSYAAWAAAMQPEFEALRDAADTDTETFLDTYGATNPAEFFAVLTEEFFERPVGLRERHTALYDRLREFYRQDPASSAV